MSRKPQRHVKHAAEQTDCKRHLIQAFGKECEGEGIGRKRLILISRRALPVREVLSPQPHPVARGGGE
jgi:hypothetical protein